MPERHLEPYLAKLANRRDFDPMVGQRVGDYLLAAPLGAGGMGSVYLGLQDAGGPVELLTAVKVLGRAQSAALLERFQVEAAALAQLRHPNIVRLMRYGDFEGRRYLVMEYVEGGRTLESEMARGLPPEGARRVLIQSTNALSAAHEQGIVHRDVKPQNIMLQAVTGDPWFVRLVDFGLAKFTADGHATRLLAGTPIYMAPEQLRQSDIGPWTDFYALAMIALEMFAGRHPYGGHTLEQVLAKKQDPAHEPAHLLADAGFPSSLTAFFAQALHFDPRRRFAEGRTFLTALSHHLHLIGGPSQLRESAVGETSDLPPTMLGPGTTGGLAIQSVDPVPVSTRSSDGASFARGESLAPSSIARPGRSPLRRPAAAVTAVVALTGLGWWMVADPAAAPPVEAALGTPAFVRAGNEAPSPVSPPSAEPSDPLDDARRFLKSGERELAIDRLEEALRASGDPAKVRSEIAQCSTLGALLTEDATAARLGMSRREAGAIASGPSVASAPASVLPAQAGDSPRPRPPAAIPGTPSFRPAGAGPRPPAVAAPAAASAPSAAASASAHSRPPKPEYFE